MCKRVCRIKQLKKIQERVNIYSSPLYYKTPGNTACRSADCVDLQCRNKCKYWGVTRTDWIWLQNPGVLRWKWFLSAILETGTHGKSHKPPGLDCNCFWASDSRVWCFVDANALGLGRVVLGRRGRGIAMWTDTIRAAHAWLQNLSFAISGNRWLWNFRVSTAQLLQQFQTREPKQSASSFPTPGTLHILSWLLEKHRRNLPMPRKYIKRSSEAQWCWCKSHIPFLPSKSFHQPRRNNHGAWVRGQWRLPWQQTCLLQTNLPWYLFPHFKRPRMSSPPMAVIEDKTTTFSHLPAAQNKKTYYKTWIFSKLW